MLEADDEDGSSKKWLDMLMAPGTSLGGARPKANVLDEHGDLWIAKFPSKGDTNDKAAWEFLVYKLAQSAGINMSDSRIEIVSGKHHTFFTKRFDRQKGARIHFASAMTMTGKNEESIKENHPSYLEIAEFIQFSCADNKAGLHQLWKRIVFNIAISNTDDHLRNHGFILTKEGWVLSPAFDINPSVDKSGLALNIDMDNNALDFELAKSVGEYFQMPNKEMDRVIQEVKNAVSKWLELAKKIGIPRMEQDMMASAFKY